MCKECLLDYRNQLNKYKISLNYKSSLIIIARKFFNRNFNLSLIDDTNHQNGLEVKVKEETISLLIN